MVLPIIISILEFEDKFRNYNFLFLMVHVAKDSVRVFRIVILLAMLAADLDPLTAFFFQQLAG